ncbi:lipoprotein [Rufibacter sp. LB8]|uniref:LptM family lipoprotein n=1 Tax=Rufibacter sp. LB8 TaxID=2777781 RepID=UPI00178C78CC|nr:hypothetical protein [Rufibacter sp. LB8]
MKNKFFFGALLVLVTFLAGCSKDSGRSGPLARPISNEQLKTELTILTDTLTGKWNVMMDSDSLKIKQMEDLLAALPPAVVAAQQRADLQKAIRRLPTLRYDRNTVRVSDRIDAYDLAHESVWNAIKAFLPTDGPTGDLRVDSLQQSIQAHHSEVIFYRGRYDKTAKEINTLLRRYKKQIPKLGKPYDTLQPMPLFQWVDKSAASQTNEE